MSKKEEIAESYRTLVIKKKSTKLSVQEICTQCHISRTTFYKHFKDVKDIIEYTLLQDAIVDNYNLIEHELVNSQTATLNWYLSFYKHKDFYLIAFRQEGQNSLFEIIIDLLYKYNIQCFRKLYFEKEEIDIDYHAYKAAAVQAMLLKKWMLDGMCVSPYKMTEYYLHSILD